MNSVMLMTHFLRDFTGSEINILDLSREFIERGYEVSVASFEFGEPLASEFRQLSVKIIDLSRVDTITADLVWMQHFTVCDYCFSLKKINAKKVIFSSLSPFERLESPPFHIEFVDLILANSLETKRKISNMGIRADSIQVFPNPIRKEFFNDEYILPKCELKRVAIVSNHVPEEVYSACDLLKMNGIEVDIYGFSGNIVLVTPDLLSKYSAVITIGRTARYCLALGIPVYCYDRFGGPGWIVSENFQRADEFNFSGRCSGRKIPSEILFGEIMHGFAEVNSHLPLLRSRLIDSGSLSDHVSDVLSRLNSTEKTMVEDQYFRNFALRTLGMFSFGSLRREVQIFFDFGNGYHEKLSFRNNVGQHLGIKEFNFRVDHAVPFIRCRLDPLNDFVIFSIKQLVMIYEEGELELSSCELSDLHFDGSIFLRTKDPHIEFENNGPLGKSLKEIKLVIDYQAWGVEALEAIDNFFFEKNKREVVQLKNALDERSQDIIRMSNLQSCIWVNILRKIRSIFTSKKI